MKDRITSTITRHIGVISESSRGWRLELNMVSWNGAEPKLDIHDWSPDHSRCTSRGTFTFEDGRKIMAAAQWWQRYLGFYEIPVGTRLLLHYRENSRKEVYLDEVERI